MWQERNLGLGGPSLLSSGRVSARCSTGGPALRGFDLANVSGKIVQDRPQSFCWQDVQKWVYPWELVITLLMLTIQGFPAKAQCQSCQPLVPPSLSGHL